MSLPYSPVRNVLIDDPDFPRTRENARNPSRMHFGEAQFCNWGTIVSSRLWLGIVLMLTGTVVIAQPEQRTTFKASLDLVSVAVVVRAADGRLVPNLRQSDFEVSDRGVRQQIVQFQSGEDADAR